ncbi:MAG: hypothetical protein M0Q13_11220 [Methanothrix sp.]|jgi:hypothetical protein|nr:hypothetical protein [Methanothrix sp.]
MLKKNMYKKVVNYWNETIGMRQQFLDKSEDESKNFKWNHLIWQEIDMWIKTGKQVAYNDFKYIVERRGFDYNMAKYLLILLNSAGLDKKLKDVEILDRAKIYKKEEIEDLSDLDIVIRDIKKLLINKIKFLKKIEKKGRRSCLF